MPSIKEIRKGNPPQEREKRVFVRRPGEQTQRAEALETQCRRLYGSDVYYDKRDGSIYFTTWRQVPKEGLLPEKFIVVSKTHPRADIFAPHTRYKGAKELVINQVTEGDGGVEVAIRAMEHILEGERGKETAQASGVGYRTRELLDLFSQDFRTLTPEQFEEARQKTYALLTRVGLNPETVVDEEKKRMARWVIKGSFGKDSKGRTNELISTMALAAAYRRAVERKKGIGEIVGKFVRAREALVFERELCQGIFEDVTRLLRKEALPAHQLFKYPTTPPTNVGIVKGMLGTLIFQLDQPHVKTYRTAAQEAKKLLEGARDLLTQNNRQEIVEKDLFTRARELLTNELGSHKVM